MQWECHTIQRYRLLCLSTISVYMRFPHSVGFLLNVIENEWTETSESKTPFGLSNKTANMSQLDQLYTSLISSRLLVWVTVTFPFHDDVRMRRGQSSYKRWTVHTRYSYREESANIYYIIFILISYTVQIITAYTPNSCSVVVGNPKAGNNYLIPHSNEYHHL